MFQNNNNFIDEKQHNFQSQSNELGDNLITLKGSQDCDSILLIVLSGLDSDNRHQDSKWISCKKRTTWINRYYWITAIEIW